MNSSKALLKIKECMRHYSSGKETINDHRLDFLTEEVSRKLERVKKLKKTLELFIDMTNRFSPLDLPQLLEIMTSKDEIKKSLIKKLEDNLKFLNNSKMEIEKSLSVLFESWESYVNGDYAEAIRKADSSKSLVDKAKKNCLIGISKETIRNVETKISTGRRHFASVKEVRKILDDVRDSMTKIEKNSNIVLTNEDIEKLEKIIADAKKAERDAQYAIDDAKAPFIVNIIAVIFGILGGMWAIYSVLLFFKVI